jgi:hypothetical protein
MRCLLPKTLMRSLSSESIFLRLALSSLVYLVGSFLFGPMQQG